MDDGQMMEPNSTLVHFYMKNIGKHEEKISHFIEGLH
jgi:hypothetical protein